MAVGVHVSSALDSRARSEVEADVIAEAHLDPASIFAGVQRFAQERPKRLARQRSLLEALE